MLWNSTTQIWIQQKLWICQSKRPDYFCIALMHDENHLTRGSPGLGQPEHHTLTVQMIIHNAKDGLNFT